MLPERTDWIDVKQPPTVIGWYFVESDPSESWGSDKSFAKWTGGTWWRPLGRKAPDTRRSLDFGLDEVGQIHMVHSALLKPTRVVRYQGLRADCGKREDAHWRLRLLME